MKRILILTVILFFGLAGFCQDDFSTYKLNNGQTVMIKEVHDNPIVIIDTWIKTGSINENDKNNGVAHFLEHLFFKGTKKYPAGKFDKILESKGAITNAATSKDYTHFYILLPSKDFNLAMKMHADMLLNPLVPRKELEKERKVVLEEIARSLDNPKTALYENMNSILYKQHPYKRRVLGKKEIIETIPREDIMEFYNNWYLPKNMVTVIVGDVDTQKALKLVQKRFSPKDKLCKKKPIKTNYKMDKKPEKQTEIKKLLDVKTGYMIMGFKGCKNAMMKDSYALDLLSTILGDGKSSRLYKDLKEKKQIVSYIGAGNSSLKESSTFYIMTTFEANNLEKVKSEIFNQINKVKTIEVDKDELQKAKNMIERETFYSRESIENIANEMGYATVLTDNPRYYSDYLDNMKKINTKDIQKAAQKYLDLDSAAISIVLPEDYKEIKVNYKKQKNCKAKVESKNKKITKYTLPNKATLLINPNKLNNIIAIKIYSKGGKFTERKPGIAALTAETMLKGTKKYTEAELVEILDENGIIINPQDSSDAFSLAAKFTKNETDLALDILDEIINNAILSDSDIKKVKNDILIDIKKSRDNPQSVAFEEFKTKMWENTAYGNTSKIIEKTIPNIKRNDIRDFYNSTFAPENTVISINGNVDPQKMIDYFNNLLQNKKSKKIDVRCYKNQFKPITKNKLVKTQKDTETSWIITGWLTDGILNKKDWVTLQVIDSLMGSGMSSRLFSNLREQQGLAYQIGSIYSANINKGVFAIYIGTNPKTAQYSKDEILKEITKLKKEFIPKKELQEAKDKLLGNYIISLETNMEKASTSGWLESSYRGYDYMDNYQKLIESVTVQDIITVANKYFSKPYVTSVIGPKKYIENFK